MKLEDVLEGQPSPMRLERARSKIRRLVVGSGNRIVVVDDDPTGTQTVHGVRVYFDWDEDTLRGALTARDPVFFICTNSRGLAPDDCVQVSEEVGRNLRRAADGAEVVVASRSDSTLRGHFPYEVDALMSGLGAKPDGILVTPAFFEGGRYTIDDIHYVEQGGELVPAHLTEFAKDPTFGFAHSDLKAWVEEKTNGRVKAAAVRSISLKTIRVGGPDAVATQLAEATDGQPIVVNAACYDDLEVVVTGLLQTEAQGKTFAYRCAASFVKIRGGFEDKPLLTYRELILDDGPGLVVVGSYIGRTSKQLDRLIASGMARGIELRVDTLFSSSEREAEIKRVGDEASTSIARGETATIYTSRGVHLTRRAEFLNIGKVIMDSLCQAVALIDPLPKFILTKGGITSIEVARQALGITEGYVLGQILPGVPVLRTPAGASWPGIPYIIFPGNVGDEEALCRAVGILQGCA